MGGCCIRNSLNTSEDEDKNKEFVYNSSGNNIVININNTSNQSGAININNSEVNKPSNRVSSPKMSENELNKNADVQNTKPIHSINKSKSTSLEPDKLPVPKRRSSLRHDNILGLGGGNKIKTKRNSVSFNPQNFQYKSMKAMFDVKEKPKSSLQNDEDVLKKKKFEENRRKSIHNEFAKVKEMMKNRIDEDEDEEDEDISEEAKRNTKKNMEQMKRKEDEEEESESSSENNKDN